MTGLLAALVVIGGGIAALLLIGLAIRFQISCLGRVAKADNTRGLSKRTWAVIITILPTIGGILYLLFGRADNQVSQAAR